MFLVNIFDAQIVHMKSITTALYLTIICFITIIETVVGQSIHQQELEFHNMLGNASAEYYEAVPNSALINREKDICDLQKTVYGWHPYWGGNSYQNYQWDLLSHMSFFSYEVDYTNGNPLTTHGWATSAAVDAALASGNTKVTLCVTLFSNHATLLGNSTSKQALITNLINLVNSRGAHGVNIDFEGIPASQTTTFANFMVDLSNQMHAAVPNSEVSTVLYAVDWSNVFDFTIMEPAVDQYIIMGYDYYYSGSTTAGPCDPLYHFGSNYDYTLSKSITYYLNKGCPKNKLILGLPYYGREWPTVNGTIPSSATGSGSSRTYATVKTNTSGNYSAANHQYEPDSFTEVYSFTSGTPRQCLITEEDGLDARLKHVLRTGIGGIGIWALGYDNGYTQFWDAIESNLTSCKVDDCSGQLFDFGGPTKNYYNNEDYTWTLSPENASSIDVSFSSFFVELNYDYLYIYDGNSTASPQIAGSPFTGTTIPGNFTSSTGDLTFRFTSDAATVDPGFLATYTCNTVSAPIANFEFSETTICQGDSILLQNTSQNATSYLWSTSEGSINNDTLINPYFIPSSSGSYTVTLNATNSQGTVSISSTISIVVEATPIAAGTVSDTVVAYPNAVVFFTNESTNASSYEWVFGDGMTSTDVNPWHEYQSPGYYDVMLIASKNGCQNDTSFFTVYVGMASINENSVTSCSVYPNPFSHQITIEGEAIESIVLMDMTGKVLIQREGDGNSQHIQDLAAFSDGIYFLLVKQAGTVQRFKLMKD